MIRLTLFDPPARRVLVRSRRLARRTASHEITSTGILASCMEESDVSALFSPFSKAIFLENLLRGGEIEDDTACLLATIGIDERAVRHQLPTNADHPGAGFTLRRSRLRPLRITLGNQSAKTPFAASGRKVLEVAAWNASRQRRCAAPLDLLVGAISDGRDPAARAVMKAVGNGDRDRRLFDAVELAQEPPRWSGRVGRVVARYTPG